MRLERFGTKVAQRRPGREPRRHIRVYEADAGVPDRSTKAGARTPATHADGPGGAGGAGRAQRRPGREPRRHFTFHINTPLTDGAQRRPGREPRRHTRTTSAATRRYRTAQRRPGREPRRHVDMPMVPAGVQHAQRRPGREPRRHITTAVLPSFCTIAQRRPGREPRRHLQRWQPCDIDRLRSTKAGARTPATRRRRNADRRNRHPLNEGRGANPGDTRRPAGRA